MSKNHPAQTQLCLGPAWHLKPHVQSSCLPSIMAAALLTAPSVDAAWNSADELLFDHPTWIYVPSSNMRQKLLRLVIKKILVDRETITYYAFEEQPRC